MEFLNLTLFHIYCFCSNIIITVRTPLGLGEGGGVEFRRFEF